MTATDWILECVGNPTSSIIVLPILESIAGRSLTLSTLLPIGAFLAALAPGFRPGGTRTSANFEATHPEAAAALRALRRDPDAPLSFACAGEAAIALEHGQEGNLFVHYISSRGSVSVAGGWLGAGRRRYIWLPLRPSLAWIAPASAASVILLSPEECESLAADIHAGLDTMRERHVLEQFLTPSAIPEAERHNTLDSYASFMQAHGWEVQFNDDCTQRALKRTDASISPQDWSIADREVLARLEALVSEALKGIRPTSRILYQTR